MYVGYRYFETFAPDRVRYPFGYGLPYTEFEISDVKIDVGSLAGISCVETGVNKQSSASALSGQAIRVSGEHRTEEHDRKGDDIAINDIHLSLNVTNTGTRPGSEVVQVYCSAPQGLLGKPAKVLCGFAKTEILQPGKSEEISISIRLEDIASFDDSGVTGYRYAYLLEAGEYRFYVGKNVRDVSEPVVFTLNETTVLKQVGSALAPVQPFERMVNSGQLREEDGNEPVPTGIGDEDAKRLANLPEEIPFTGDCGIKLADVAEGRNTLEEFTAQLSDEDLSCIIRGEGMGSPKVTAGTASAFGGVSKHLQELGVPCVCCSDGPSGMRLDCGTKAFSLPSGTSLACTWDRELLTGLFTFTGLEMSANKVECLLGPGMNIHRYPLNGRNFEYFSEDPFVTGEIAVAQLKGLHEAGVTGTIKHFCGNNQETRRHFLDSVISERALREIYLKGFETAVKRGGAYTIMTTYGSVNGLYTAGSYDLTTTILRGEWGFEGVAMTDWWANISRRGQGPDKSDFAAMAAAQNDLYMVCADGETHDDNTLKALGNGMLKRCELQRNAMNILKAVMRTNAMKRLIGTADTVKVIGRGDEEADLQAEVPCYHVTESVTVDLSGVKTARDTSYGFILDLEKFGRFNYTLTASSDAGELAQIPVTVFSMGTASGTFTFNGTGGKAVSVHGSAYMFSRYTTVRLYFAQGGLNLENIVFKLADE
ncbi:MAG: fibronectin type III-like domain-contianing protein [Lachnospiraceae bacterium]|nr:fibronectin type III-like domain-contianing protein [Lachnospiraceae bacterium]